MRLLITAGPTHEPIDAVRYLANRSSGRTGIGLAIAARDAGHHVRLLLGPTHLTPPDGVAVDRYASTHDLSRLLDTHFSPCDALVMAAAVADYTPIVEAPSAEQPKLERGREEITLRLRPTPDLVAGLAARRRPDQRVIAFALEPAATMIERATAKRARKGVDAIVANPLDTPDAAAIDAAWITPTSTPQRTGPMPKGEFASWLLRRIEALIAAEPDGN
ncbi:MAG: phosphopantothenoylcysteine decarboxylase [Planctomycetota bacterium]